MSKQIENLVYMNNVLKVLTNMQLWKEANNVKL